ncbi:hypothetical protein QQX98_007865 [Neonectria punicea]|uniref:Major facilitator superfamily (MFS) profile domain-containing protein n=1 Tax=Neonectria punicea TaxID=979145 RepID=A0ABR1GWR6_9HYPO
MNSQLKNSESDAVDEQVEEVAQGHEHEHEHEHGYPHHTPGTVRLFDDKTVVLIPTPSPDPKDPLNLPQWHKYLIILLLGLYSSISVLGTSGLGAVFTFVLAEYPSEEATKATQLLTYPTLFMGIGNLVSMPLSVAVGRRPCACATTLDSHIAARNFFSLAAGQSEALAPLIVQEIHFLHERGAKVAWFVAIQVIGTAALFVATTYLVPQWGIKWWYGIMTIINGVVLILSYFCVVETRFDRPNDAIEGEVHVKLDEEGRLRDKTHALEKIYKVTTAQTHVLEPEKYGPRTWRHDLTLFHFKPDWSSLLRFYKETGQSLLVPSMLWLMLLNGAFLGVYVYQVSTFAQILMGPPYNWKSEWLGFVQMAQILDCAVMLPLLGYGSDRIVKVMSRLRNGVFEPEYRIISLIVPAIAMVLSCVLFGRAGAHPEDWSWATIAVSYNLGYFAFLGANTVGITYAVDSFPHKAGPLLLIICAGRGFISFGLSYSTVPFIELIGYDGAMNILAIICGVLSGLGIIVYIFGKGMRSLAQRWFWKEE